ncbi:MAG TPA: MFS transporter [Ktedonobacterales bacterium]|nr:MFS transporter [Ktedonobacterales bacterium]
MTQSLTGQATQTAQRENRPLFALFGANIISYIGDYLMILAIPWFVLQTTGSITETGITAFFSTLPTVLAAFFGSALVDRLGYKRTSIVSDLTSGVSVALIPLLYSTVGLAFWQLLALVFFAGLLPAPGATARSAMIPDLVARTQMPLERANAISDGIRRVSGFIGAPLAGVLIAFTGTSNLLWLDALSFVLSAALVALAVTRIPSRSSSTEAQRESTGIRRYVADLWEGLRFIRQTPVILAFTLTVMITNLLDEAHFAVVYPDYVRTFFGSAIVLGVLVAAFGGAAFAGTLIYGIIGPRLPRRLTFGVCFILISLRFGVMALVPPLYVLIITNILSGLAAGPLNPIMSTVEQEQVPQEMRARVFGTTTAGAYLGMPVGAFAGGFLVQWAGIQPTLLMLGACYLLTTASLLVNPALRAMDKRKPLQANEQEP